MKKGIVLWSALAAILGLSAPAAAANVCLQIDGSRDNLTQEERAAARGIFQQAVESMGDQISGQGCETYVVTHMRTAEGIKIRIVGPRGSREAMCQGITELRGTYRRMLISIRHRAPMMSERGEVPKELVAPKRQAADKLFYARLGQGFVPGDGMMGGPDLGLGLRVELDQVGIDASMNLGVTQTGPKMNITGYRGSWLKVTTHYFLAPEADNTPYLGAGLSWGGRSEEIGNHRYGATGLSGELVAGWEFLRSSTMRIFIQADASLPMYAASSDAMMGTLHRGKMKLALPGGLDQRYLPTMGLSLGIAWGRPHVIGVEKVR